MSISIENIDPDLQLDIFAAILKQDTGLVAMRELENGKLIYINEAGSKILGTADDSLLELLIEQNKLGIPDITDNGIINNPVATERELKNINGETFLGKYEEILFKYDSKNYCLFRITEVISARLFEQRFKKELDRFEALFGYANIGILVTNEQGEIVLVNDFALEQFAYERNMLLGKKIESLIPERIRLRHIEHRTKYNASPQNRPIGVGLNLLAQRRDGSEFPVEVSLCHYSTDEGNFVIVYISDITERRKTEVRIEKLQIELGGNN